MSSSLLVEEKLDPRVVRTRNLLGKAFLEVLAEKGFPIHLGAGYHRAGRGQPHHVLPAFSG